MDNVDTYHSQKETAAWTATAAFVAVVGLIVTMPQAALNHPWVAAGVLLASALAVLAFLHLQFDMRWLAADRDEAIIRVMAQVCEHPESAHRVKLAFEESRTLGFPYIGARPVSKTRGFFRTLGALGGVLLIFTWFDSKRLDPRWKTEAASYVLVILTAIIGVGAIVNSEPQQSRQKPTEQAIVSASSTLVEMQRELHELRNEIIRLRQEIAQRVVPSSASPVPPRK